MHELIEAAKAVIDDWDSDGCTSPVYPRFDDTINALRDAVERAERQEAVGFEKWWRTADHIDGEITADRVWIAAQLAERERLRQKVAEIIRLEDFDDVMAIFDD